MDDNELKKLEHDLVKNHYKGINQVIEDFKNQGFDEKQLNEIELGLVNYLSLYEVQIFAKLDFNHWQMSEIREGLEFELIAEQVKSYADPKYDRYQMCEIRLGLEFNKKHPNNQIDISLYQSNDFDGMQMCMIRTALEYNAQHPEMQINVSDFAKPEISALEMLQMKDSMYQEILINNICKEAREGKEELDNQEKQQDVISVNNKGNMVVDKGEQSLDEPILDNDDVII